MYRSILDLKRQIRLLNTLIQKLSKKHQLPKREQDLLSELQKQLTLLNMNLITLLKEYGVPCQNCDDEEPCKQCPQSDPEPPIPQPVRAHGYAYTQSEINESGVVMFQIAGPLEGVELTPDGLSVSQTGVYQISYSATLHSTKETTDSAIFQIVVNDVIHIDSSIIETALSQHVSISHLYTLMEGDIVKLVAEIPDGMSYSHATMQLVQVG